LGMSIRAFADLIGVSHTAVRKRIMNGTLSTLADGTVDERQGVREWVMGNGHSTGVPGVRDSGSVATMREAKAVTAVYNAELLALDLKKRRGELVNAEEVRDAAFNTGRRIRELLLSVPSRLAPVVAGLTSSEECFKAIETEMNNICDELTNMKEQLP